MPKAKSKKKRKSKKAKKDPNRPKRNLNAYMIFVKETRASTKEKNPQLTAQNLVKYLANLWKAASDEVKKKYKTKAEEDKKRYAREMAEYVPPVASSPEATSRDASPRTSIEKISLKEGKGSE